MTLSPNFFGIFYLQSPKISTEYSISQMGQDFGEILGKKHHLAMTGEDSYSKRQCISHTHKKGEFQVPCYTPVVTYNLHHQRTDQTPHLGQNNYTVIDSVLIWRTNRTREVSKLDLLHRPV